jgi:N-acetylmuramoyl-L-alanine amidase
VIRRLAAAGIALALFADGAAAFGGTAAAVVPAAEEGPLAGRLIVLDPGHQLGNSNPRFATDEPDDLQRRDRAISIHADGASSGSKGFFALAPTRIKGWTDDVVAVDRRLAKAMIAGMTQAGAVPSNYIRGQLMLSGSTTTLNMSNVPTTTIEVGNMRNASDARRMTSSQGQQQYAEWLFAGIERFFQR